MSLKNINDFNESFENGDIDGINRSLRLIISETDCKFFTALPSLQVTRFLVNLHSFMDDEVHANPGLLLNSLSLLERAIQSETTRKIVIEELQFVPVVARLLDKHKNQSGAILALLQRMTFGLRIHCPEPYLDDLIATLVEFIVGNRLQELALGCLVNICYRNLAAVYAIVRSTFTTKFLHAIKDNRLLASKMYMILEGRLDDLGDVRCFVRLSVEEEVPKALRTVDVARLRQTVQMVGDAARNAKLKEVFEVVRVGEFVERLDGLMKVNEAEEETFVCAALCLELIRHFVGVQRASEEDEEQVAVMKLCFMFLTKDMRSTVTEALKLLRCIVVKGLSEPGLNFLGENLAKLPKLISSEDKYLPARIALLELLQSCVAVKELQEEIFKQFSNDFFDLIYNFPENYVHSTPEEVLYIVNSLSTLQEFSNIRPRNFYARLVNVLKLEQIQISLGRALRAADSPDVIQKVIQLGKLPEFPDQRVAHIAATLPCKSSARDPPPTVTEVSEPRRKKFKPERGANTRAVEEQAETLIGKLNESLAAGQEPTTLPSSKTIELYSFRLRYERRTNDALQRRLRSAEEEISALRQARECLTVDVEAFEGIHLELSVALEHAQKHAETLTKNEAVLKESLKDFREKLAAEQKRTQDAVRDVKAKGREMEAIREENRTMRVEKSNMALEISKLKEEIKEMAKRNEEMRKSLKSFEDQLNTKNTELQNAVKRAMEAEKENSKMSDINKKLEKDLSAKDTKIEQLTVDLEESERVKTTIMALISNNKKAKKEK